MAFVNEFSWSAKRDRLFTECKRKYYNEYYGSSKGWFYDAPEEKQNLWMLKNLESMPFWNGRLVREAIRKMLSEIHQGEKPVLEIALQDLEKDFQQQFSESKTKLYKNDSKKYLGLMDHEYGLIIDNDLVKEKLGSVKSYLKNFYDSPLLNEIRSTPLEKWIFREEKEFPCFYFNNTKVFCMYDLAIMNGQELTVYDWTTGTQEDSEEDLDVKNELFLLYFTKEKKLLPSQIKIKKIYLKNNYVEETNFKDFDASQIKNHLKESISKMRNLLQGPENNLPVEEEKFSKTDNESNCRFCKYKKNCFPGAVSEFVGY